MDYHSMKRKELQALCKEHNIPANLTNAELANKLSELFNEKQKPTRQRACLKSSVETVEETDSGIARRQTKKVRFSPNNEVVEYEMRSGRKDKSTATETMTRRKSVGKKIDKLVVDNAINFIESVNEGGEVPARVTRSRVQKLGKDDAIQVNEKKRGRRAVKDVENENETVKESEVSPLRVTRLKGQTVGKGVITLDEKKQHKRAVNGVEKESEAVNGNEVNRIRVTRSKVQTLVEDGVALDLNPQVKKKSGRGVAKDVVMVEPSKSVRVTRSREQTLQDDKGNTVADFQAEKKRARTTQNAAGRSSKSTVMSTNAASEGKQEFPQRKSLRNREVEIDDEDVHEQLKHEERKKRSKNSINEVSGNEKEADKGLRRSRRSEANVEVSMVLNKNASEVENRKTTRSRAQLAPNSVEGNSKSKPETKAKGQRESKMVHEPNEPLEHAGRRNVNRGKSAVSKPDNSEEKGIDKSVAGKKEMVRENKLVQLPNVPSRRSRRQTILQPIAPTGHHVGPRKTSGRKQSKEQSSNLSSIEEGASRNEMNEAAHSTGNRRVKKRTRESVNEQKASESEYASPIHGTPRQVTLSAGKSEEKAVANLPQNSVTKLQQRSNSKTPKIIGDNNSNKRARLSMSPRGTDQSNFKKGRAEKSNKEEASASKFGSIEINEQITKTLAVNETARRAIKSERNVNETPRRVTRSVIKSERNVNETPRRGTRSVINTERHAVGNLSEKVDKKKQPSVSALRGRSIEDAQLSSPEVAEVGPDPGINETRSAIENERTPVDDLFAEVDNEKQSSLSALRGPPVGDSLSSSPGLAEVRPITDDTNEVHSENVKEAEGRISLNSGDLSASASMRSQNQEVCEQSAVLNETEVQIATDSVETSILKTVGTETYEKEDIEMTTTGSRSARLETDDRNEEQEVRAHDTAATEEMVDMSAGVAAKANNADSACNFDADLYEFGSSADYHMSQQQLNSKTKLKESEIQPDPSTTEGVSDSPDVEYHHVTEDGVDAQIEMKSKQELEDEIANNDEHEFEDEKINRELVIEPDVEDNRVHTDIGILQNSGMGNHDVADGVGSQEMNSEDEPSTNKNACQSLSVDEHLVEYNRDDIQDIACQLDPSSGDAMLHGFSVGENRIEDDIVTTQEIEAEKDKESTGKTVLNRSPMEGCDVADDGVLAEKELIFEQELSTNIDELPSNVHAIPVLVKDDVDATREFETESKPSAADNVLETPVLSSDDVEDEGTNANKELESVQEPSTGNYLFDTPVLSKDDVEYDNADATKEFESGSEPSSADNIPKLHVSGCDDFDDQNLNANEEVESDPEPSIVNSLFDTSLLGNTDGVDPTKALELDSDVPEIHVFGRDDVEDEGLNGNKELELESKPSTSSYLSDTHVLVQDDVDLTKELESDSGPSTAVNTSEVHVLGPDALEDEGVGANKELESDPKLDASVLGKDDGVDITREVNLVSGPSIADNIPAVPVLCKDYVEDDVNASEDFEFASNQSTANNILETLVLSSGHVENEGIDANKEIQSDSLPSTAGNRHDILVLSRVDVEDAGANAFNDLESESKPSTSKYSFDTPGLARDDIDEGGVELNKEIESDSETRVSNEDDVEGDGVNATKDFDSDSKPLTADNILETRVLTSANVEDEVTNANKDLEAESKPSAVSNEVTNANKELEDGGVDATMEPESELEPSSTTYNAVDVPVLGSEDGRVDATIELESELEPSSTTYNVVDVPVLGSEDVDNDGVNANKYQKFVSDEGLSKEGGSPPQDPAENFTGVYGQHIFSSMTRSAESEYQARSEPKPSAVSNEVTNANEELEDGGVDAKMELESELEPSSTTYNVVDVPVLGSKYGGVDATIELESELEPSSTTYNVVDVPVLGSEDVEDDGVNANKYQNFVGDESLSKEGENVSPYCSLNSEESNSSFEQTDYGKYSGVSVGVPGGGSPPHVEKSKDPAENSAVEYGQHIFSPMTRSTESEYQGFSNTELRKEEAEIPAENDHVVGTIGAGAHESAIREESSPITLKNEDSFVTFSDAVSDPLPSLEDNDKDNQAGVATPLDIRNRSDVRTFTEEETQKTRTSKDPGNFDIDEYQSPVQAHESDDDDALGDVMRDSRVSDLFGTSSARASCVEGSCSPSTELFMETKMEKASINVAVEKSIKDLNITRANPNITIKSLDVSEEFFSWSDDSSLREFFATPATTSVRHVKDNQEDTVSLEFPDKFQDLGSNEAAVHDHHDGENESLRVSEFGEDSSLREFFATPATTSVRHVKDNQEDTVSLEFPDKFQDLGRNEAAVHDHHDDDSSLREFFATPATTSIHHVKDNQEGTVSLEFPDKFQDLGRNEAVVHDHHDWENESFGVSDFGEEAKDNTPGSPDKGKNDNFIFEDDQFGGFNEPQTYYHKDSSSTEPQDIGRMENNTVYGDLKGLEQDLPESTSEIGDDFASEKVTCEKLDVKVAESQTCTITAATPHKLIMTSDMKENAKSFKGEHTAKSTIRRRALENIIPEK